MRISIGFIRKLRLRRHAVGATTLILLAFSACVAPSVETRKAVEAELAQCLPDESHLPKDWRLHSSGPSERHDRNLPGRAFGGVYVRVEPRESTLNVIPVRHEILAYSTPEEAAIQFERQSLFYHFNRLTPWLKLDLSQNGLSADSLRAGCAYFSTGDGYIAVKQCLVRARYNRFLSELSTYFSPGHVSMEEMSHMLKAIDSTMLGCVDALGDRVWGQAQPEEDTGLGSNREKSGVDR